MENEEKFTGGPFVTTSAQLERVFKPAVQEVADEGHEIVLFPKLHPYAGGQTVQLISYEAQNQSALTRYERIVARRRKIYLQQIRSQHIVLKR